MQKVKVLLGVLALMVSMLCMSMFVMAADLQKPGKVTGLQQTKASETAVTITWDAQVTQYCRYEVFLSTDGVTFYSQDTTTSTEKYISGLSSGKTYYVKVQAYAYDYVNTLYADEASDVIKVVTVPGSVSNIKQTAATTSSATLKWTAGSGATQYYVYTVIGGVEKKVAETSTNQVTIKNLKSSVDYTTIKVYSVRKDGSFVAQQSWGTTFYGSDLKLIPAKVNIKKVDIANYWSGLKEINVTYTKPDYTDGYQVQVYTYNGKKVVSSGSTTSSSVYLSKLKKNQYYKLRVRGYSLVNGTKKYGAWSSYKYFSFQPDVISAKQVKKTKTAVAKWDTVKGATSYTIYLSTKQKSGYKKVGTTKKTSFTLKKYGKSALKKNKTYYVYVVANKKVGKTTYTSDATYCYQFKLSK